MLMVVILRKLGSYISVLINKINSMMCKMNFWFNWFWVQCYCINAAMSWAALLQFLLNGLPVYLEYIVVGLVGDVTGLCRHLGGPFWNLYDRHLHSTRFIHREFECHCQL